VIVLCIIFVAIPNKAQHEINASTLEVTSQEVTNPQPDGVHLKIDTVIRSGSSYHPRIDSFRAGLSLDGQDPFLYIQVPEAKSEAETRITVEQDVDFTSMESFTGYTKAVLASESFDVHLDGKTNIHLSGLPSMDVNFNKVITMKGKCFRIGPMIPTLSACRLEQTLWSRHYRREDPLRHQRNPLGRLQPHRKRLHPQSLRHDTRPRKHHHGPLRRLQANRLLPHPQVLRPRYKLRVAYI
jgi:hypothetical protein